MLKKLHLLCFCLLAIAFTAKAQVSRVPGHVLIQLKPQAKPAEFIVSFATQTRAGGGVWIEKALSQRQNIHLLKYDTTSVEDLVLISELTNNANVLNLSYDYRVENRTDPDDPGYWDQWGVSTIEAQKVWETTTGGQTANGDRIVVAILDSGFDVYHEDMADNIWTNRAEIPGDGVDNDLNGYVDDYYGWNFINDSPEHISDAHGHSVAGIIGAKGNNGIGVTGINWDVELMVLEARMVSDIIAAYEYIIDQRALYNETKGQEGAFIVATNASFGINKLHCADQPLWGEMYEKMGEQGILTAAGTANNAWDVDAEGDMPTTCPSEYLMTVLNTNDYDERYIGSAYGAASIDMGAPGQNSFTTKPFDQYGNFHGNSAAAPHLAGAIALLYSAPCTSLANSALDDPAGTAQAVRDALFEGVDRIEALEDQTVTGGRLNVYSAMENLMSNCAEVPTEVATVNVLPNPAHQQVRIAFESSDAHIQIVNAMGQQVFYREVSGSNQSMQMELIDTQDWRPGLYFVFVEKEGQRLSQKFVVMHE
jgi:subtilisin family serine protease